MDAHVYAALASGDLTVEQLNEFTLHFAVYCGWPRASQLEASVRSQWQRLHEERGEPVPAFPARTIDDLGVADPAERLAGRHGVLRGDQPHPVATTGFAVLLRRHPELRVRPPLAAPRPVAVAIGGSSPSRASASAMPSVRSGPTSPPRSGSGDVSPSEMEELIVHFSVYAGTARAKPLHDVASQWQPPTE